MSRAKKGLISLCRQRSKAFLFHNRQMKGHEYLLLTFFEMLGIQNIYLIKKWLPVLNL